MPGSFIPYCSIAQAQLSVIDSCTVQERVVPGSFIPYCSIAQAQLSVIDSCTVLKRVVPGSFIPLCSIAQAQLSVFEQMFCTRRGWCLEVSFSSVPLRRRSFLPLTHVLYRKGWCREASFPIAPWRRRSFPSTDTGMQSSFSCPFQVSFFVSFSDSLCNS